MRDHDDIKLHVNGRVYSRFTGYTITHNLYTADSKFQFLSNRSDVSIQSGMECKLTINDITAMTGIVDEPLIAYDKQAGITQTISGRDIMGLVVDQYTTRWRTFAGKTLRYLAETLLQDVPLVSKKEIVFEEGTDKLNVTGDMVQPEPGQTVFEILKNAASARGVLFYADASGKFVFTKPKKTGEAQYKFVVEKTEGGYVNRSKILSGNYGVNSIRHYRTIRVVGETSDGDKISRTVQDETAPINKTMVVVRNDTTALSTFCNNLINQQRFVSESIVYRVSGHSQNGAVFMINNVSSVRDDVLGVSGDYLIYGLQYKLAKNEGITTEMILGQCGVIV